MGGDGRERRLWPELAGQRALRHGGFGLAPVGARGRGVGRGGRGPQPLHTVVRPAVPRQPGGWRREQMGVGGGPRLMGWLTPPPDASAPPASGCRRTSPPTHSPAVAVGPVAKEEWVGGRSRRRACVDRWGGRGALAGRKLRPAGGVPRALFLPDFRVLNKSCKTIQNYISSKSQLPQSLTISQQFHCLQTWGVCLAPTMLRPWSSGRQTGSVLTAPARQPCRLPLAPDQHTLHSPPGWGPHCRRSAR